MKNYKKIYFNDIIANSKAKHKNQQHYSKQTILSKKTFRQHNKNKAYLEQEQARGRWKIKLHWRSYETRKTGMKAFDKKKK